MIEGSTEVFPERRLGAWIIGRKEQREHVEQAEETGRAHANSQKQSDADGQFAIGDQKSDGCGMRKHEAAQNRHHERIGAVREEAVDPELKPAVKCELSSENFVLSKNEKENTYADAQECERPRVGQGMVNDSGIHRRQISRVLRDDRGPGR